MNVPKNFRIGVYGIIYENNKILFAEENIKGFNVIKFPGGGMNLGEGTIDALKREFYEELNEEIEVVNHIYTTDFFVQSAIDPNYQVLAIYYHIKLKNTLSFKTFEINKIKFFWEHINAINKNILTFETDKIALEKFLIQNKIL